MKQRARASVGFNLYMSVRSIAGDGGVSYTSIHRILKSKKLKPFKIYLVNRIYDGDEIRILHIVAQKFY